VGHTLISSNKRVSTEESAQKRVLLALHLWVFYQMGILCCHALKSVVWAVGVAYGSANIEALIRFKEWKVVGIFSYIGQPCEVWKL